MNEFQEKIRSIAAPRRFGQSRTIIKQDERDGSVAGREREHWDDRRDAVVTPKTLHYSLKRED